MQAWNDERLERTISVLLITGVALSALVVLAGGVCFLYQHGGETASFHVFHPAPESYQSARGVIRMAVSGDCLAVIQLGLLLLIATPIARVACSLVAFGLERDRTYIALTSVVLAILVYSLAGGH